MFSSKNQFLTGAGGYQISRSVRLRSSATAYFNRTFGTPTSATTWTWSGWVKRGALGSANFALFSRYIDASNFAQLRFTSSSGDELRWYEAAAGVAVSQRDTTQIFRDPSAWYHIVLAYDTTQSVAADRVKIYINGAQVTAFATTVNRAQNASGLLNAAAAHQIGALNAAANFDGYLTEINFIDGQALTPSSFGETDAITGVWKPKKYTGTYGTNGFYLNFSDNSSNTATTIGKDYSGNGNNWTPNNISVTAGVTYDSMLDVPTLYADGGNGRGNYSVLNPILQNGWWASPSRGSISNGNLTLTQNNGTAFSTFDVSTTGKWYLEGTVTSYGQAGSSSEFIVSARARATFEVSYLASGQKTVNGTNSAYGSSWTTGDVIGIAIDPANNQVTFYKNNVSQGAITNTFPSETVLVGYYAEATGTDTINFNFGQRPFTYTPPTGFVALNTQNLPTPTISNGAAYMAATTWTSAGGTETISNAVNGVSFQPDFLWMKNRSIAQNNYLVDSNRGTSKILVSNTTSAEVTDATFVTAFNSNGFSLGSGGFTATQAIVGWQWKAGGTSSSNTNGSITSTVSVGATQGFSVVTYTGTGANATVGHGLGVAPKMIIVKERNAVSSWMIAVDYGAFTWSSDYFQFDTGAKYTNAAGTIFRQAPTSSVFSVGTNSNVNGSTNTLVAYCFSQVAGFSAFGSYTGNGSADGPFVYCGFRPRWVMIKRTDSADDWIVMDSSRNTYNVANSSLFPNGNYSETTDANRQEDFLSNGFKVRSSPVYINASGGTYIFAAFAENSFKLSLAR